MHYKLSCVESLHQKKKENELIILYILDFTFSSIPMKQQVIASFLTASEVNGGKKSVITMIKNFVIFLSVAIIFSNGAPVILQKHLLQQIYLINCICFATRWLVGAFM